MEKIIVPLWKQKAASSKEFTSTILDRLSGELSVFPAIRSLTLYVVDKYVEPASLYRMTNLFDTPYDAVMTIWVDAVTAFGQYEEVIRQHCSNYAAYLVTESDQLPQDHTGPFTGERSEGMWLLGFLQKPDQLSRSDWLEIWQGSHTQVAIDTQSTFGYRQNVVVRAIVDGSPTVDAFIEEHFPEEAIHSRMAFYDAEGDEPRFKANEAAMIESVTRFIDLDWIESIPTSGYRIK